MVDELTRLTLLGLYLWVIVRSVVILKQAQHPARLRSLKVMAVGSIVPALFWFYVFITIPVTNGGLAFTVWLSRVASGTTAVAFLALQAFIRDAENVVTYVE